MKRLLILIVSFVLSFYSNAQQNKDSARREAEKPYQIWDSKTEREKRHQKWLSVKDSLLSDSLFNSYSDFRSDTNGKMGFRIKYFEAHNIPYPGLCKKRILEFLGKPNSI